MQPGTRATWLPQQKQHEQHCRRTFRLKHTFVEHNTRAACYRCEIIVQHIATHIVITYVSSCNHCLNDTIGQNVVPLILWITGEGAWYGYVNMQSTTVRYGSLVLHLAPIIRLPRGLLGRGVSSRLPWENTREIHIIILLLLVLIT